MSTAEVNGSAADPEGELHAGAGTDAERSSDAGNGPGSGTGGEPGPGTGAVPGIGSGPATASALAEERVPEPRSGPDGAPGSELSGGPGSEQGSERIEQLLASFAASGPLGRQRAEELVRLVLELHGAGLERLLEIAHDDGVLSDRLLDRFADDEVVSGVLLLHGLHPYDVHTRVEQALEKVRPYLGSHGGDVRLLEVTDDGVARLRMLGSCQGCPSSSVTLTLAVEGAVEAAAPEIERIECDDSPEEGADRSLIPTDSLFSRVHRGAGASGAPGTPAGGSGAVWTSVDLPELVSGQVLALTVADTDVVVCRVGSNVYAYRNRCASCGGDLGGASLQRVAGSSAGTVVLVCGHCRSHFDVRGAGAEVGGGDLHLEPLPLLAEGESLEIALPRGVPA